MNKVYTRINWENYPSENTAVNESNLNKMDSALNEIDTRVVEHDTIKANVASLNNLIDDWHIDETTGVITIHKVSGEQIIFDLNIEKVPVGFSMTEDGILVMTTDDGTEFTANIGSMIPVLTFNDSDQIAVAVSGEGVNKTYTFTIKTGSITADKLQPNFLADVTLQAGNAEISARAANQYAQKAKEYADEAKGSAELANTDGIVSIMNQATTTWVMPDYMQDRDTQPYVCGIGTPEENGYSADDYNDETGYGEPYLDVRSGMVYEAIRIKDLPLTYGWVEKEQLENLQNSVENNNIGTSTSGTVLASTVDSSTKTAVMSLVIPEDGVYTITAGLRWTGNSTGFRSLLIYGSETPYYDLSAYNNSNTQSTISTYSFIQQYNITVKCKKGDTYYLWAWQNSGASLAVALQGLTAIRIA